MTFQKFFENNYSSKFIKALLRNTYLPNFPTISEGYYMLSGKCYLYGNTILKCRTSGVFANDHKGFFDNASMAAYDILSTYIFGEKDKKLSNNFVSVNSYYDPETHVRLGEYLRCYRDIYGIDLMSLYNCFAYQLATRFYVSSATVNGKTTYSLVNSSNEEYKLLLVPIKFNRTYTVAVDCSVPYLVYPVLYGKGGLVKTSIGLTGGDMTSELLKQTVSLKYSAFNSPYTIRITCPYSGNYSMYEKSLYIVLQLPSDNKSSITVLEGDYTSRNSYYNADGVLTVPTVIKSDFDMLPTKELNSAMLCQIGLLQVNDGNIYAFSNKLMEYLLKNAIDPTDEIPQNIYRIQERTNSLSDKTTIPSIFDQYMRSKIFNNYIGTVGNRRVDINGYVDRDTEKFIYTDTAKWGD